MLFKIEDTFSLFSFVSSILQDDPSMFSNDLLDWALGTLSTKVSPHRLCKVLEICLALLTYICVGIQI